MYIRQCKKLIQKQVTSSANYKYNHTNQEYITNKKTTQQWIPNKYIVTGEATSIFLKWDSRFIGRLSTTSGGWLQRVPYTETETSERRGQMLYVRGTSELVR